MARIVVQKARGKEVWWVNARHSDGSPIFSGVGVCVSRNPLNMKFYTGHRDGAPLCFDDQKAAIAEAKKIVKEQLWEKGL